MSNYVPSKSALEFIAFIRATGNEENKPPIVTGKQIGRAHV